MTTQEAIALLGLKSWPCPSADLLQAYTSGIVTAQRALQFPAPGTSRDEALDKLDRLKDAWATLEGQLSPSASSSPPMWAPFPQHPRFGAAPPSSRTQPARGIPWWNVFFQDMAAVWDQVTGAARAVAGILRQVWRLANAAAKTTARAWRIYTAVIGSVTGAKPWKVTAWTTAAMIAVSGAAYLFPPAALPATGGRFPAAQLSADISPAPSDQKETPAQIPLVEPVTGFLSQTAQAIWDSVPLIKETWAPVSAPEEKAGGDRDVEQSAVGPAPALPDPWEEILFAEERFQLALLDQDSALGTAGETGVCGMRMMTWPPARVDLDGEFLMEAPSSETFRLTAGRHTFRLTTRNGRAREFALILTPGRDYVFLYNFETGVAALEVNRP